VSAKIIESKEDTMTRLQEYKESFAPYSGAMTFLLGIVFVLMFGLTVPTKTIKVPVIRVVEKPIIVQKPVYLNKYDRRQIQCLADNAYYEAGNQTIKGKIAVTNVVMNRVNDGRFPSTPCGVIYQKHRGTCQFSWTCQGRKRIQSMKQYFDARKVAEDVYLNNVRDITKGAKFYHAHYVNPRWKYRRVARVGDHIFYRG
jgi:spore germination cell wall hydrolase CwlJ-like protein